MAESKKRFRPTLGAYRALERENEELRMKANVDGCYDKNLEAERDAWKKKFEEQLDGSSLLVQDCDGWRDKYREKCDDVERLEGVIRDLQAKEKGYVAEIERMDKKVSKLNEENERLLNRGFLARLFNR